MMSYVKRVEKVSESFSKEGRPGSDGRDSRPKGGRSDRPERQRLPRAGVAQEERHRVEPVPGITWNRAGVRRGEPASDVQGIPGERVSRRGQVDPDLMRPSGLDADLAEGSRRPSLQQIGRASRTER